MLIGGISSQLLRAPSAAGGMLRNTTHAAATNAAQAMNMPAYAHGLSTSAKVSASSRSGILLKTTAMVLFTQCMSMVSFSEPVL